MYGIKDSKGYFWLKILEYSFKLKLIIQITQISNFLLQFINKQFHKIIDLNKSIQTSFNSSNK